MLTNPAPAICKKTTDRHCLPAGVKILPAEDTTHDGILRTMEKYLVTDSHEGDTVLFYYSGHGSLRLNSARTKAKAWVSIDHEAKPADNTLVPADAYPPLNQAAVILARSSRKQEAANFLAFLKTRRALAVLKRYGFAMPEEH